MRFRDMAEADGFDKTVFQNKPPTFAHWRWQTLWRVIKWKLSVYEGFLAMWTVDMFKGARKAKQLGYAYRAG